MVKNFSQRITSLLTLAIFIFTALSFSPASLPDAKAADSYQLGDLIAYEGATANSYDDSTDSQVTKKLVMNSTDTRTNSEKDSTYYYLFKNYVRNPNSGNLCRCAQLWQH